jgi:hypothetical protein
MEWSAIQRRSLQINETLLNKFNKSLKNKRIIFNDKKNNYQIRKKYFQDLEENQFLQQEFNSPNEQIFILNRFVHSEQMINQFQW